MEYSLYYLFGDKVDTATINVSFDNQQKGYILLPENVESGTKYPVLYLIHGTSGYVEWRVARQGNIVQNINKWQKDLSFAPMIIVMPNVKYYEKRLSIKAFGKFSAKIPQLVEDVGRHYSDYVFTGDKNTAIAGFSLGGAASLYYSILNNNLFLHTGAFSPSTCLYCKSDPDKGWVKSIDDFVLNSKEDTVQYIGYGTNESRFMKAAQRYVGYFNANIRTESSDSKNTPMNRYFHENDATKVIGGGHNFNTFNELLRRFLSVNLFGEHHNYK